MATIKMLKRVANPRKAKTKTSPRVKKGRGIIAATAPKRKTSTRRKSTRRNPALLVTLGAVNPYKGNKTVARKKRTRKAVNPAKRKTSRRRNTATKIVVMAPKRANYSRRKRRNPVTKRRRRFVARRNPNMLGMQVTSVQALKLIAGGLVGVTATKTLTAMLPPVFVSSAVFRLVASGAVAFLSGMLAGRIDSTFGSAVAFGGYMQTGSLALNAFVPTIGSRLSLGELMPGQFTVPQNPISAGQMAQLAAAPQVRVTTNGLARAYGNAAY